MIPLALDIRRGGTTYTYTDARLLAADADMTRRVDGLDVELGSIRVDVGPAADGSRDLAGYTDPIALPTGTVHRARLRRTDTGATLLNGAFKTDDLEYLKRQDTWRVQVFDQAPSVFWDTLQQQFWDDIVTSSAPLEERTVKAWRRDDEPFQTSIDPEFEKGTVQAYRPLSVLRFIFDELGWSEELPDYLYSDASSKVDVWMFIGRWRLKTVVEQISSLAGLRLMPGYTSWPGDSITVKAARADYQFPSGLPTIDGGALADEVQIRTDGEGEGLQYANDVAEASPDPYEYGIISETEDGGSFDTEFDMTTFAFPPAWALLGLSEWRVDPPYKEETATGDTVAEGDSRTVQGEVEELRLRVPPIDTKASAGGGTEGRVLLPAQEVLTRWLSYEEETEDVPAEDDNAFIFATTADGDGDYLGHWGEVTSEDPLGARGTAWIESPFAQRPQQRARRLLRSPYKTSSDFTVGDAEAGVQAEGYNWVVAEQRFDLNDTRQDLTLQRPPDELPITRAAPDVPTYSWRVVSLKAKVVTIDRGGGAEDWLLAHWERTALEGCREYGYDVEYEDGTGSFQQVSDVLPTAFTLLLAGAGNGGQSYDRTIRVRPKAVNTTGSFSETNVT